jgi:glutathione synthase/RimK-type ligase-like ATP-grasp enzyme
VADVCFVSCGALPAPDPDTPLLVDALRARGCSAEVADWRDPTVDWSDAAVTVLRSPWDYSDARDEFVAWAERTAAVSALWNPAALVRWNTHKAYLLELASWGPPVVPTVVLLGGSTAALDGIAAVKEWDVVVVKPAVGVGAYGAGRFLAGDPAAGAHLDALLREGDALVQPFVSSIELDGEVSVVLVDGRVTHAVRKVPAVGEFRIHEHWGGRTELVAPTPALVELAERVLDVLPWPTLYGRVDVVAIDGMWHVMELEATEPSLWLDLAPASVTGRLADAIVARLPS